MFTKKINFFAVALVLSLITAPAIMARSFADIYIECGLGAMIAPHTSPVAVVTNVTWDLGTTAISSNISCPDSCVGGQAKSAAFIFDSYESLEKDIARGQGEYLDTLMTLTNVSKESQGKAVNNLRNNFAFYVANQDYTNQTKFQKSENLYNILYSQSPY
ncbi:DUF3015 family protein [Desulforhopalus vacuolatus]|uniref:DUF3015 family protein n=1 Tax=Desulforhopalus vacuolatus TaxID=40414 RepID=UPI00196474E5|nr:DUF3015 family protein [Desulforhopalus vacuolatus]MBM9520727.1 DUF3015 family protein [Desulforhopalus vacuolatus]